MKVFHHEGAARARSKRYVATENTEMKYAGELPLTD